MSVDSSNKRFSVLGLFQPVPSVFPAPDGEINDRDRAQYATLYYGISLISQNGGSSDPARRYLSIDEVERLRKVYARAKGVEFERDNQPLSKPRKPVIEAVRAVIDIDTMADQVVEPIFTALKKQHQLQGDTDDQFDLQSEIKALEAHIEEHKQIEEESLILLMMAA